ncbi:MAG: hypothetical protein KC994_12900 [Candidatus Omnitrophica bacterium]|nr:hypothetical protein [Candidatus Omnitrophota bacterium]
MKNRLSVILILLFLSFPSFAVEALNFQKATIVIGNEAGPIEKRIANLLAERLQEPSGLPASVIAESEMGEPSEGELQILLGIPDHSETISKVFYDERIDPLTELDPGLEGFLLKLMDPDGDPFLLAAGLDERGCLYAVGEILRKGSDHGERVSVLPSPRGQNGPGIRSQGDTVRTKRGGNQQR